MSGYCQRCGAQVCTCGDTHFADDATLVRLQELESQLTAEREARQRAEADYKEESAIVTKIWELLGNPSYASLKGKSIYDLIADIKQRAEAAEARIKASQEQAPVNHLWYRDGVLCPAHPTAKDELRPVYAQPIIPPEVTELQARIAELEAVSLALTTEGIYGRAKIAELEKDAEYSKHYCRHVAKVNPELDIEADKVCDSAMEKEQAK